MADQFAFGAALLNPHLPVPEGVIRPDGTPATKRFNVYRNNVVASLIEALGAAYPGVLHSVGHEFFRNMASIYVRQHPPSTPLMILYGADFPAFLEAFPPAAALPFLPDLARLERARRESYHETDAEPCPPERLAALDPDDLIRAVLHLHPSVRVVSSDHPILTLWQVHCEGADIPIAPQAQDILVSRPAMAVTMTPLLFGEATFLSNLKNGASLGAAADTASSTNPEFDLSGAISCLFRTNVLIDVSLPEGQI